MGITIPPCPAAPPPPPGVEDIPDEILQACFARLPPRSVARLRLVCKRWLALSDAHSLHRLRQSMRLTQPFLFTVASKYEQGRYAGLQITSVAHLAAPPRPHACPISAELGRHQSPAAVLGGSPRLQFAAAASADGRLLYILGGRSHLISHRPDTWHVYRRVDAYDVVANRWLRAQPMQKRRYAFALAAFAHPADGRPQLVVAGGYDARGCALASAELYDVPSDRWHSLPSMNSLSGACKGEFTRGKFYVAMANNGPLAVEAFDPVLLCWSPPVASFSHGTSSYLFSARDADDDHHGAAPSSHKCLAFDASRSGATIIFKL